MSHFFAEFAPCGSPSCIIRKDTRVYYRAQTTTPYPQQSGNCVGVVWMCNPGSAQWPPTPAPWRPIQGDPTLWRVLTLYQKAVAGKNRQNEVKYGDYILILNCLYAVDPNPDTAFDMWRMSGCSYKESVPASALFVVVAWGRGKPQGPVHRAITEIESLFDGTGKELLVAYIDPSISDGTKLGTDLNTMHYPAHPGSPAFAANMDDLAAALADHILGGSEADNVMEVD